jgi:hypothetical protein
MYGNKENGVSNKKMPKDFTVRAVNLVLDKSGSKGRAAWVLVSIKA